jgi:hypothetical protein
MGATRKPRKPRRQKWVAPNPMQIAIAGAHKMGAIDIARFMLPLRGAVAAIVEGRAERDDWACLFDAVNTVEQLCKVIAGKGWRDWVEQTQADVLAAYGAPVPMDDGHAQALHHVADTFSEMLGVVTCRQMLEAQSAVVRKVNAALTAKRAGGSVQMVTA